MVSNSLGLKQRCKLSSDNFGVVNGVSNPQVSITDGKGAMHMAVFFKGNRLAIDIDTCLITERVFRTMRLL